MAVTGNVLVLCGILCIPRTRALDGTGHKSCIICPLVATHCNSHARGWGFTCLKPRHHCPYSTKNKNGNICFGWSRTLVLKDLPGNTHKIGYTSGLITQCHILPPLSQDGIALLYQKVFSVPLVYTVQIWQS